MPGKIKYFNRRRGYGSILDESGNELFFDNNNYNFWNQVEEKIEDAKNGDTFEVAAPAVTNAITAPAAEPEVTDARRGLAETPELAEKGIEQAIPGVFEPESIAPAMDAAAPQGNSGGLHGIGVLLAALAVGGGFWFFWKRREQSKQEAER